MKGVKGLSGTGLLKCGQTKGRPKAFQVQWFALDRFYLVASGSLFAFICAQAHQAVRWASRFTISCVHCKVWPVLQHLNRLHKRGQGLKGIMGVQETGGREAGFLGLHRSPWEFRPRLRI